MTAPYKVKTYLIVDTKNTFLLSILNEILPNTYIIEIIDRKDDLMRIKGTKDYRIWETSVDSIFKDVKVLNTIEIIQN